MKVFRVFLFLAIGILAVGTTCESVSEAAEVFGTVFKDPNQDGVQQPGEAGIPDVSVTLLYEAMARMTDANGQYDFTDIPLHTYTFVQVMLPPGYVAFTGDVDSSGLSESLLFGNPTAPPIKIDVGLVPVPLPGTAHLLGAGLLCLAYYRRWKLASSS